MDTFIVEADAEVSKALIAIFKALNVSYQKKEGKKEGKPYDPAFVKMVQEARKGKSNRVNPEKLWESIL